MCTLPALNGRLAEVEGSSHDNYQVLAVLRVREKFLEDENNTLMERIASLSRQKHNLERMVKEYEAERDKQVCRYHTQVLHW